MAVQASGNARMACVHGHNMLEEDFPGRTCQPFCQTLPLGEADRLWVQAAAACSTYGFIYMDFINLQGFH